MPAVDSVLVGW